MALTLAADTQNVLELHDYLELINETLDVRDTDQILETAVHLRALANNRQFLAKKFNDELGSWKNFQPNNAYSAQTLALGKGKDFFVRANMWVPPAQLGNLWEWESQLFAYSRPHDHNFSFLTVGYVGSGYGTTIYEVDPDNIKGIAGEAVALRFLEHTTLPEGKVMFYRASRDIHNQEPPEEFSISLNLMVVSPEVSTREQYWFDVDQCTITGRVQNPGSTRLMLCRLARYVGNDQTSVLLEDIADHHAFPLIRSAAYESLACLNGSDGVRLWERALARDSSPVVHAAARAAMQRLSA